MHMTCLHRSFYAIVAILTLILIPEFSGCKSKTPTPNASTQNNAATASGSPSGTASGTASGSSAGTALGSSSNVASGSGVVANNAAPPKPVKVTLTVASGKDVNVRMNEAVNAKTANVGDRFTGVLSSPLTTKTGETVFAKNTKVFGAVVAARGAGPFCGFGRFGD
jgi:hypothetical protein